MDKTAQINRLRARINQLEVALDQIIDANATTQVLKDIATMARIGLKCAECRAETLEPIPLARKAGWSVRYPWHQPMHWLCPKCTRRAERNSKIMKEDIPQRMEVGPERG